MHIHSMLTIQLHMTYTFIHMNTTVLICDTISTIHFKDPT